MYIDQCSQPPPPRYTLFFSFAQKYCFVLLFNFIFFIFVDFSSSTHFMPYIFIIFLKRFSSTPPSQNFAQIIDPLYAIAEANPENCFELFPITTIVC